MPPRLRKLDERFNPIQISLGEPVCKAPVTRETGSFRKRLPFPILARQQTIGEREVGQERYTLTLTLGEDSVLRLAMQQTIVVLHADKSRTALRRFFCFTQLLDREVRAADLAHLTGLNELIERAERVCNGHSRVRRMKLIEVNAVGSETAQTILRRLADVGRAGSLARLVNLCAELGRN